MDGGGNYIVADCGNARVIKWTVGATEGEVVASGKGEGAGKHQLLLPHGVAVDGAGNYIVADFGNDRAMKWAVGATEGEVVAGGRANEQASSNFIALTVSLWMARATTSWQTAATLVS